MSSYVVIARTDSAHEERILRLMKDLSPDCSLVNGWPPHITVAAYENIDEKSLTEHLSAFCEKHSPVDVALPCVTILPPGDIHPDTAVLCLGVAHSKRFTDMYYAFHGKYEEYCTGIGAFNSIADGNPLMHMTLGIVPLTNLSGYIDRAVTSRVFDTVRIERLELYTYPMRLIKSYELKGKEK